MSWTDSETVLKSVFVASLVTANIVAAKIAFFGGFAVPAGFLAIGVGFLCTDLLGELYGKTVARKTVNATVVALVVAWGLVYSAIAFPSAPFYDASAFNAVMGASGTIVTASILTTLVSQNVDVSVFHWVNEYTDGSHAWARNISSTAVSQLVDTTLFIVLGFVVLPSFMGGTVTPLVVVPVMILGQYAVKLVVAVADTPVFYVVRTVV